MTAKSGSKSTKRTTSGGLARTFATLAKSQAAGAQELLLAGLAEPAARVQLIAAHAILKSPRRGGVKELIAGFHALAESVADDLVAHIDDFIYPLRETLADGSVEARRNAVDVIVRAGRVKLAYLLVQALSDKESDISVKALDGLKQLAEGYHRHLELARAGALELSRTEIETRKFALLDPIMSLLGNLSLPQPDELLLLTMGLDVRTNDLLFAILNSKHDPRSETLAGFLWNASGPQVISFVLDGLRDARVGNVMVTVIQKRRDLPFVRSLLGSARFFTDYRVRDRLGQIESLDFLWEQSADGPNVPRRDVFVDGVLAMRAIHFLVLSGVVDDAKAALLRAVSSAEVPLFVRGLAESTSAALAAKRHRREVSLALVHLENRMGLGRVDVVDGDTPSTLEMPELELPWAHPDTEALPGDAFAQFFNTFDQLDEATRLLAVAILRRLDPEYLGRLQEELGSLESDRRLKAVKIVVMFHREQDVEETLLRLTRDENRHVRATVVKTLGVLEDEAAIRGLLQAVTDIDRRVVANTVEAIETVGRQELLGLVKIFASHPNNRIRANAVKALWSMGEGEAGSRLDEMLTSMDEMMRLSATWLLGEIDHARRIDILMKLSKEDPSERVRAKARRILGEGD